PLAQVLELVALPGGAHARLQQREQLGLVGMMELQRVLEERDARARMRARLRVEAVRLEPRRERAERRQLALDAPMEREQRIDRIVDVERKVAQIHAPEATRRPLHFRASDVLCGVTFLKDCAHMFPQRYPDDV